MSGRRLGGARTMWKEFKEFALKGSMLDLAVGIVIGGAIGKIVTSLVNDVIMPPIGALLGGVDFASLYINLSGKTYESYAAAQTAGAPVIGYGMFVNAVIDFLIIALVIFLIIKGINKLRKAEEATTKECPFCTTAIPIPATRCPACTSELATA